MSPLDSIGSLSSIVMVRVPRAGGRKITSRNPLKRSGSSRRACSRCSSLCSANPDPSRTPTLGVSEAWNGTCEGRLRECVCISYIYCSDECISQFHDFRATFHDTVARRRWRFARWSRRSAGTSITAMSSCRRACRGIRRSHPDGIFRGVHHDQGGPGGHDIKTSLIT